MPLPPILAVPNREKGTENVAMLGVTFRMTITSDGFCGMSFEDMSSSPSSSGLSAACDLCCKLFFVWFAPIAL